MNAKPKTSVERALTEPDEVLEEKLEATLDRVWLRWLMKQLVGRALPPEGVAPMPTPRKDKS